MSAAVTVRTKKVMRNALLARRQCSVDIVHPGRATVPKTEIRAAVAKLLKVKDEQCVVVYGVRTDFGGNRSTGFGLVYDSVEEAKKRDKASRLWRLGVATKVEKKGRKGRKESKNRSKKVRGKGLRIAKKKAKRAAE